MMGELGQSVRKPCTCKSDFQDQKYGKGIRLHSIAKVEYRCSVCGNKVSRLGKK